MWRWSRASAGVGAVVWLGWLGLASVEQGPIAPLLLFALFVLVPLALPLADTPTRMGRRAWPYCAAVYVQPVAALSAAGSFLMPAGPWAALLAAPWLGVTILVALFGLWRLLPRGLGTMAETCLDAGLLYLPIGGAWLVVARIGARPLDFPDVIVLLTAVHFHYAGFVAPVLAAMVGRALATQSSRIRVAYRTVGVGIIVGSPLLAAGFTLSPALRLVAALLLAASVLGLAVLTLLIIVPTTRPRLAAGLLGVSSAAVLLPMLLVGVYAVGEYAGAPAVSIPQMAQIHGWLNAFGFALCGLLAWTLAPQAPSQTPPGLPVSRLVSRGRVGPGFLERARAVEERTLAPAGLVDNLAVYRRDDFDPGEVHPAIREFYEHTAAYAMAVRAEWWPGFRLVGRLWGLVSGCVGQEHFRVSAERAEAVESRMVAVKDAADGRASVRAWIRTYRETHDAMYVALYAHHALGTQTYMNVAMPWPCVNETSILRVESLPMPDSLGMLLTTLPTSDGRGDEGVYCVTPLLPVRLPLDETIRVWVGEADSSYPAVPASIRGGATVVARHDFWCFGIPCLTLRYRMWSVVASGQ